MNPYSVSADGVVNVSLDPSSYGWRVARGADGSMGLYLTSSDGEESGPYGPR